MQYFGKDAETASVSEGCIIIGAGNGSKKCVRIYSLMQLLSEENKLENNDCHNLGDKFKDPYTGEVSIIGNYPWGIPLNYKQKESLPVLYEVLCSEQVVHFGGHPFHSIVSSPKNKGIFKVFNVKTGLQAQGGCFDFSGSVGSLKPDTLVFHWDETERILHCSKDSIELYKITSNSSTDHSHIQKIFEFKIPSNLKSSPLKSSSRPSRKAAQNKTYYSDQVNYIY